MHTFLWNFRIGATLFVIMFVDRWQKIGPLESGDIAMITAFSFGILMVVQCAMWLYRLILLAEKRAAMLGAGDLRPDARGYRTGRLKPLYRFGMPVVLIPMGGIVMSAPLALGGWQDMTSAVIASVMVTLGLILVHQGAWHYTYRFSFNDRELVSANRLFGNGRYNWGELNHITDDKAADSSLLIFENSGTARIPLFSEGHETLLTVARKNMGIA